jgi:IS30 family transposase
MPYRHLTPKERYVIYHMRMAGWSAAKIGRRVGRHRSTIGRELKRNSTPWGHYLDDHAQRKTAGRRQAASHRPCTDDAALMAHVERKIEARWSPEQIAGRIRTAPPAGLIGKTISHATIYRWIWACRKRSDYLRPHLRVAKKKRRKPYGKPSRRGQIPNRVSIDERPEVVAGRDRLGDWEGDTVVGKGRSGYVATCVDRASRYLVARKQHGCSAKETTASLHSSMRRLPSDRRRTLTVDNGREFSGHEKIARLLSLSVYFAHPYSSWERGTNENTNGLLRQYLPKSESFQQLTACQLERYVNRLNNRPRKCLNYRTPAEVFWRRTVALGM